MVTTILSVLLTLQSTIVPINDLIKDSRVYDEKPIVIEAEVILEVLERDEYAWINVNDGSNAIGVYLPIEMTENISFFGDHSHIGDTVLIEGIFYRNCDEHGGELDIHATSLTILDKGYKVNREVSVWKFAIAFISFSISIIVLLIYRNRRKEHKIEE